jgi:hypothetical protein
VKRSLLSFGFACAAAALVLKFADWEIEYLSNRYWLAAFALASCLFGISAVKK